MSRLLKTGEVQITRGFSKNHLAVDFAKDKNQADVILAHSAGKVVFCQTGQKNDKGSTGNKSYGNCIKIDHENGFYTLYAHLKDVYVQLGQRISKGQEIGYMGDTGNATGIHLHFEVRNSEDHLIDPTPYIESNFSSFKKIDSIYRVYSNQDKRWFNEARNGQTAGNGKDFIGGIQFKTVNGGPSKYKVHLLNGKWLPEVKKWDNSDNGYAGIKGKDIDGVAIYSKKGKIKYRVKTEKRGWLPWVTGYNTNDNKNGYAGNYGERIVAIQIKID